MLHLTSDWHPTPKLPGGVSLFSWYSKHSTLQFLVNAALSSRLSSETSRAHARMQSRFFGLVGRKDRPDRIHQTNIASGGNPKFPWKIWQRH